MSTAVRSCAKVINPTMSDAEPRDQSSSVVLHPQARELGGHIQAICRPLRQDRDLAP
jgi:hypothetical protein